MRFSSRFRSVLGCEGHLCFQQHKRLNMTFIVQPVKHMCCISLLRIGWRFMEGICLKQILHAVADARHHHPLTVLCSVPILGPSLSSATLSFFFFLFRVSLSLIYPHPKLSHVSFCQQRRLNQTSSSLNSKLYLWMCHQYNTQANAGPWTCVF